MIFKSAVFLVSVLSIGGVHGAECPRRPYVYFAEVTGVYDADTITADIDCVESMAIEFL